MMKLPIRGTLFIAVTMLAFVAAASAQNAPKPQSPVTEISADLGSCKVEFKITDMLGHPLYNAKIKTTIRYGFLSKRKLSLEAATNSDGRARFINMPDQVKNPIEFEARYGDDIASMTWDPGNNCRAEYPVLLGKKPEKE